MLSKEEPLLKDRQHFREGCIGGSTAFEHVFGPVIQEVIDQTFYIHQHPLFSRGMLDVVYSNHSSMQQQSVVRFYFHHMTDYDNENWLEFRPL